MRAKDLLKANGYKPFPVPGGRSADHAYSRTILAKPGKRYIHAYEYERRPGEPDAVPEWRYVFEIVFEIGLPDVWFKGEFYSIAGESVASMLPVIERQAENIFHLLDGKHDD